MYLAFISFRGKSYTFILYNLKKHRCVSIVRKCTNDKANKMILATGRLQARKHHSLNCSIIANFL